MPDEPIEAAALAALADDCRGDVIAPGDDRFDDARAVWNGMIDKEPGVIVRCTGVADVQTAVSFARAHDLEVAVRGGGHNVAGTAVCDDGIVVDLSEMTAVTVDPDDRAAWVQAGATWADVDHETQAFGLATPGGVVSKTGVAGLTLGGGIGHLRCKHGLTCDNLRSVELVTADGEYVRASPDDHEDLFWALRGGPGTLGIVTAFEYELHPVGPEVATCLVFYHADELEEVLASYRRYTASSPDDVSTLVFAGELPEPALFDDETLHEGTFAIMGCHAGDPDVGQRELAPLREFGTPLADESAIRPYAEFQQLLDEDYPDGMRYYWKSLFLDDLGESVIDRISYWADQAPSALSTVDVWELGGAITDVGLDESAFGGRHARFLLGVEANWEDPAHDEANVQWVRDCLEDMRQFSDGSVYVNFPGFHEGGDAMLRATYGEAYARLESVAERYDPDEVFGWLGPAGRQSRRDRNRGPS